MCMLASTIQYNILDVEVNIEDCRTLPLSLSLSLSPSS